MAGRPPRRRERSARQAAGARLKTGSSRGTRRERGGSSRGAWARGRNPDEILLDELGLAMRSVGEGWEAGDYSVDDEHRASGVATRVVARLGARFTKRGPRRRSVILGTPPHELHGLPTAMAANVLRGQGYDVIDLGADVPPDAFGAAVTKTARPLAVAVAVTSGNHDRSVRAIVRAVEQASPGLPVLVGGAGIKDEEHAARLGAAWSGGRRAAPQRGHRRPGAPLALSRAWPGPAMGAPDHRPGAMRTSRARPSPASARISHQLGSSSWRSSRAAHWRGSGGGCCATPHPW